MNLPLLLLLLQPSYTDKADLLYYLTETGQRQDVRNEANWKHRRADILANLQKVMGPLPPKSTVPLDVQVIEEEKTAHYIRRKITYVPEPGDRVPAYLFIPIGHKGKRPAMLCLHQTTKIGKSEPAGLGGKPNLAYAKELAEKGFVALAPDYPNYGDYKFDAYSHGYVSATMKGIVNHRRGVDLLQSLPEVNPRAIGVIGHSLGGHNSLFVATFDDRIKAVVTSCGFNSFAKYLNGNLKGWSHKGYMPRIIEQYGASAAKMPFDFTEILGALAPRAVFINAPLHDDNFEVSGVYDCVRAAAPVYEKIYKKRANLVSVHPDAAHDFPPAIREQAYQFLQKALR